MAGLISNTYLITQRTCQDILEEKGVYHRKQNKILELSFITIQSIRSSNNVLRKELVSLLNNA